MDLESKEVIVNLMDVESLVENQDKNLLALFIEVDGELVDVLVYAIREHFAVIPYKSQRVIKFTLRDILTHEKVGDARIKMGVFSSFEGSHEHKLYLDGLEKYRLTDSSAYNKPFVNIVYEWKDPEADPEKQEYIGDQFVVTEFQRNQIDLERRMRQSETDLQYVLRDILENMKRDTKDTDTENSAKTQELENQLLQLIQVNEFREVTLKQKEATSNILEKVEEFSQAEGKNLGGGTESINTELRKLDIQISEMEQSIGKFSGTRKQLESEIAAYTPIKVSPEVDNDISGRTRIKDEVADITREISAKTLDNARKMKEDGLLWGLEQSQGKIAYFDDIQAEELKLKQSRDQIEDTKSNIRDNQAKLANSEFDLILLEQESKSLGQVDRDLNDRLREASQALEAMLGDRRDAADRGNELEQRAQEYEQLLSQIEQEVNELKAEAAARGNTGTQDILGDITSGGPEIKKLQEDLAKAEADRDQTQQNLEKMDGAWIQSVEEVSRQAESLVGDSDDNRFRNEVDGLLKDIVASSKRSADLYEDLEATDQQINMYRIVNPDTLGK